MIGAAHGLENSFPMTEYKFGPVSNYVYQKLTKEIKWKKLF